VGLEDQNKIAASVIGLGAMIKGDYKVAGWLGLAYERWGIFVAFQVELSYHIY